MAAKINNPAIIPFNKSIRDVTSLPEDNIDAAVVYRLTEGFKVSYWRYEEEVWLEYPSFIDSQEPPTESIAEGVWHRVKLENSTEYYVSQNGQLIKYIDVKIADAALENAQQEYNQAIDAKDREIVNTKATNAAELAAKDAEKEAAVAEIETEIVNTIAANTAELAAKDAEKEAAIAEIEAEKQDAMQALQLTYDAYMNELISGSGTGELVIPEGTVRITEYAFYGRSYTTATIPASVVEIGAHAFDNCAITQFNYDDIYSEWVNKQLGENISIENYQILCSDGLYNKDGSRPDVTFDNIQYTWNYDNNGYKANKGLKTTSTDLNIVSSVYGAPVVSIGDNAFESYNKLTSVVIPDGVVSVGSNAFTRCTSLINLTIPESVVYIGDNAFSGCKAITNVYIPNLTVWCNINFGNWANPLDLNDNSKLYINNELITELIVPNGITEISQFAFCGYNQITSVVISDGVTSIGKSAFNGCKGLISVVMTDSVTNIGAFAFSGCTSLTTINLSSSLEAISECMLQSCSSLTSLEIPDSVTYIDSYAFGNCNSLSNITIGSGVSGMKVDAFCSLTEFLPNSILVSEDNQSYKTLNGSLYTKDGTQLIKYASGRQENTFAIPDGVTTIGWQAFVYDANLETIIVPNSVAHIGSFAFSYSSCKNFDFSSLTTIPTLEYANVFSGTPSDTQIIVADNLYDSWIVADKWSTYAANIIKVSEVATE